jgi:hypothetical protein
MNLETRRFKGIKPLSRVAGLPACGFEITLGIVPPRSFLVDVCRFGVAGFSSLAARG